jgi:hypothetical protein
VDFATYSPETLSRPEEAGRAAWSRTGYPAAARSAEQRLMRFPSGSLKIIERFPHGWVAGGRDPVHAPPGDPLVFGIDVAGLEVEDDFGPVWRPLRPVLLVLPVLGEAAPGEPDRHRPAGTST